MITVNSHPNKSTAIHTRHKATNQIEKIGRFWPFLAVMLRFHLSAMYFKFYVILFVIFIF